MKDLRNIVGCCLMRNDLEFISNFPFMHPLNLSTFIPIKLLIAGRHGDILVASRFHFSFFSNNFSFTQKNFLLKMFGFFMLQYNKIHFTKAILFLLCCILCLFMGFPLAIICIKKYFFRLEKQWIKQQHCIMKATKHRTDFIMLLKYFAFYYFAVI